MKLFSIVAETDVVVLLTEVMMLKFASYEFLPTSPTVLECY